VTLKEIKQAIWSCDASKALGSDGFTLVFFFFLIKKHGHLQGLMF
jgi:hypothetical protein